MESRSPARVLVVAHRTAATPALIEAVRRRVGAGPCTFTLLVPASARGLDRAANPEESGQEEAEAMMEMAVPLLEEATGQPVEGRVGDHDPFAAVQDAVHRERFDEVIVSTLPTRVSRWLHLDLPRKVASLGIPVTTVTAKGKNSPASSP